MNLILCIKKGRSRAQFMRDARRAGVELRPVRGLPRHFTVDGYNQNSFPLKSHTAIVSIEDGDAPVHGAAANSFTIADDLTGGNWGLARLVRRDAPWNVDRIRTPINTYYRSVRDGTGVDIYILDTGIRATHDEFDSRVTNVYEFYSSGGASDDHGHGTSVASLASGLTVGVARESSIFSFKCLDSNNAGTTTSIATALGEALTHYQDRSATNRPAVMVLSIVGAGTASAVEAAIEDIIDAGIVVCGIAGNTMSDLAVTPVWPGMYTDVVCCGGLGMADIPYYAGALGTSYGARVDILAGAQTCRAAGFTGDSNFVLFSGTSAAAPLAAGVVACMLEGKSRLTTRTQVQAVKAKLLANATTGRFRAQSQFGIGTLPDRILYLDPDIASETIDGVT